MYKRIYLALAAASLSLLLPGCVGLDFSPDGKQLVLTTTKGLTIMNVDGTGAFQLPDGENGWMPNWSPDGKRILFLKHEKNDGDLMMYEVKSRRLRKIGGDFEALTGWREDGRRFVALHKRSSGGLEAVEYDVVEGGVAMRIHLPFDSAGPLKIVWLPDTDDFALMGGSGEAMDVYAVEAGEVKKITRTADVIGLGLSGDGKKLLWARRSANMKYILLTVYGYDLKTRSVVRMPFPERVPLLNPDARTAPQKLDYVTFSPDGARIAILASFEKPTAGPGKTAAKYAGCYIVRLDGGDARLLYRTTTAKSQGGMDGLVLPAWSRDGGRIALLEAEDKLLKVAIFNADGTGGRRIFQEVAK